MFTETAIRNEMRLFALETIVCQCAALLFQSQPQTFFETAKAQAMEGARNHVFPGVSDPAMSDAFSAEFHQSLERLYGMIKNHLDNAQKHGRRELD